MIRRAVSMRLFALFALGFAVCACNLMGATTPEPTLTPSLTPSHTPPPSATFTPSQPPTRTPTPTITPTPSRTLTPSVTPTASRTPTLTVTPTLTSTPYPTVPPLPTVGLAGDQFARVAIPPEVVAGVGQVWLSFINTNDQAPTELPGTPVGSLNRETVVVAAPDGRSVYTVLELPTSSAQRVYWSPDGAYLAYFLEEGQPGLYVLDIRLGVSIRLFAMTSLSPRGILSEPVWSPDSRQITLALTTAYDVDIFSVGPDGTSFRNLTPGGAFDRFPRWSPDSRYLAFVSDRDRCSTWEPNAPDSCYTADVPQPDGGTLYVLDTATAEIRQVASHWVIEPPTWIGPTRLAFIAGTPGDRQAGSTLYSVDVGIGAGVPTAITNPTPGGVRVQADSWSPDGGVVVYQEVGAETAIVIRDANGVEIARSTALPFPRFAFGAAWSPSGQRLVLSGRNSQCPTGIIVLTTTYQIPERAPSPNPGVCDPTWSPDGNYIAYTGVQGSGAASDGRFDVYVANAAGTGTRNLTSRLSGQARLLGWIGGR